MRKLPSEMMKMGEMSASSKGGKKAGAVKKTAKAKKGKKANPFAKGY